MHYIIYTKTKHELYCAKRKGKPIISMHNINRYFNVFLRKM